MARVKRRIIQFAHGRPVAFWYQVAVGVNRQLDAVMAWLVAGWVGYDLFEEATILEVLLQLISMGLKA